MENIDKWAVEKARSQAAEAWDGLRAMRKALHTQMALVEAMEARIHEAVYQLANVTQRVEREAAEISRSVAPRHEGQGR